MRTSANPFLGHYARIAPVTVKILNPILGGATRTNYKRALRYVKAGRAEFVRGDLRFRIEHHADRAAEARHSCGGYDSSVKSGSIATDEQLAGVPIVKPRELTAPRGRLNRRPMQMSAAEVNGTRFARGN